jgi:ATP-dependent helicase/nuclease subunit A
MTTPPLQMLPDEPARARIRDDLGTTLIVTAAAGTGKTTALVSRIVALVSSGRATLQGLVAVTYTDKAAGEMKLRLRTEIERARSQLPPGLQGPDDPRRPRLDRALAELELAHIGTIHALCGDLLRERPVEAGVDPSFEIVAGDAQSGLYDQAFERWFQRVLADPPEGVRRVLRRQDYEGPRSLLREAGWKLVELRGFPAPWRRDPLDRAAALDEAVSRLDELRALADRATEPDDWLAQGIATLGRWKDELDRRERLRGRDHDGLEAELRDLANPYRTRAWTYRGRPKAEPFGSHLSRAEAIALRDGIKAELDRAVALCEADLAACLREDLRPLVDEYEAAKVAAGKLDFVDLVLRARDLIRESPEVRRELQARYSHVLIDEFQDTDPLQAEILLLLAADDPDERDFTRVRPRPGKLFVVGDPKQSIYRFRHADLALYQGIADRLCAAGAQVVQLQANFRSVPALQGAVNGAFAPAMRGGPQRIQADYAPLQPVRPAIAGQPALVALPIPAPYKNEWGDLASGADIERSSADAIAAFIEWLVGPSGWKVLDSQAGLVPVEARHICLLFRRLQSFGADTTRHVVRALEARRLPHVLVGGRGYGEREEVEAMRNALCAIEWPEDEFSVYATLRGPLFCLSDGQLLVWRHALGSLHPFLPAVAEASRSPQEVAQAVADKLASAGGAGEGASARAEAIGKSVGEAVPAVASALALLARLHRSRNRVPIADTILQLLGATRAHAGIAIWPNGEQALANVLRVVDLARRFEAAGASSFRGFVERLRDQAERNEAADAPVLEDGSEGVRIMTVHKAKGLEFPVVVLADPTVAHTGKPSRHIDPERGQCLVPLAGCIPTELLERQADVLERDAAESVRLTYVAATRARDLLVVPVVGDQRLPGWVDVLHPALYPPRDRQRQPQPAPGCPAFGVDSLVVRPSRGPRPLTEAVAPGLHQPELGAHTVVWWDPNALALDRDDQVGLRQQEILKIDHAGTNSDASIRAHDQWQQRRRDTTRQGARPTLVARTVTEHTRAQAEAAEAVVAAGDAPAAPDPPDHAVPVLVERVASGRSARPHGRRFGTLVHAVLAEIPLDGAPEAVQAAAAVQGRYLGCNAGEVDAAAATVGEALRHPLLRRAAAAQTGGRCRRELPLSLRLPDGTILDGVVDLAFIEPDSATWTVVDFKTDLGIAADNAVYENQVRLYARAIAEATGAPARAVLLYI